MADERSLLVPEDILNEFDRIRGGVDYRSVVDPNALNQPALDTPRLDSPYVQRVLNHIAQTLEDHPRFSKRFDFWWATHHESYTNPAEVGLQNVLIAALADSAQDHPNLERLKPTAIRCVTNPQFSSVSINGSAIDFVCVSLGFMKFLQLVLGALIDFHDAGEDLRGETKLCNTNVIFGQDAERTLRERPSTGEEICGRVVHEGLRIFDGNYANHHSPIFGRMMSDIGKASPLMPALYTASEGFIALHELAHLLAGHEYSSSRQLEKEVEADVSGMSLMIVASSVLGDRLPVPVLYGPPLFFQASRLYALIHRMGTIFIERDIPENEQQSMEVLVAPEAELKYRMERAHRYLNQQVPMPPGSPDIFHDIVMELSVLIVGCQQRFLAVTGQEIEFEEVLKTVMRKGTRRT